jgi:hypothetical protein
MNSLEPWDVVILVALMGFKMVPGVALALYYGLDWWTQFLLTGLGGSLGIVFFTYLGAGIGRIWSRLRGKRPSAQPLDNSWKSRLWLRYGLWGTALLTPPLLSPPVGTALALAFGTNRLRILYAHLPIVWVWSLIFTEFGQEIVRWVGTDSTG